MYLAIILAYVLLTVGVCALLAWWGGRRQRMAGRDNTSEESQRPMGTKP